MENIQIKSTFVFPQKKPTIYKSKTQTADKSSILNQKDFEKAKETIQFIKTSMNKNLDQFVLNEIGSRNPNFIVPTQNL